MSLSCDEIKHCFRLAPELAAVCIGEHGGPQPLIRSLGIVFRVVQTRLPDRSPIRLAPPLAMNDLGVNFNPLPSTFGHTFLHKLTALRLMLNL